MKHYGTECDPHNAREGCHLGKARVCVRVCQRRALPALSGEKTRGKAREEERGGRHPRAHGKGAQGDERQFDRMLLEFKSTGKDTYFDLQITNEDPTSAAGRQVTILKDCNIDSGIIAAFDADGEWLEQDVDFTFEDVEQPTQFKMLDGMQ